MLKTTRFFEESFGDITNNGVLLNFHSWAPKRMQDRNNEGKRLQS